MLLFRESNYQRLSPWGWPFSCFPDLVIDLCQNINHGLTPHLLEQVLLVYYQLLQTFPFSVQLLRSQLSHEGLAVDLLLGGRSSSGC